MSRRHRRAAPSLAVLCERAVDRAFRAVGFAPQPRPKSPRSRRPAPRLAPTPPATPAPGPVSPAAPSPGMDAYLARFPAFPAWLASVAAEDLVLDLDASRLPCMADAEDGEQPWDDTPAPAADGSVRRGAAAFPFVGPPDDHLDC